MNFYTIHTLKVIFLMHIAFCTTRNLSFLRFHRRRHHCCFNSVVSLELVGVGLKSPLNEHPANVYAHVVVVRGHVWRTLCSVCATGARVAHPFLSNS